MATRREEDSPIGIVEAVETLSSLADLDEGKEIGVTDKHTIVIHGQEVPHRAVQWLDELGNDETISVVKDTFRAVLDYLQGFNISDEQETSQSELLEGIKEIMVLVGEAANKLDRFTNLFKKSAHSGSVTNLQEYRDLQDFYTSKLARKIEEETSLRWAKEISELASSRISDVTLKGKRIKPTQEVVDLDGVIKDLEYELFSIRKEDGGHFYNPRVIRNIKLICDFGNRFGETSSGADTMARMEMWVDKSTHIAAKNILRNIGEPLDRFYRDPRKNKDREFAVLLNKAMMSLMLSANPRNLLHNTPVKSCHAYFTDFQVFFREALTCREYQKYVAYSPKPNSLGAAMFDLSRSVCHALFSSVRHYQSVIGAIEEATIQVREEEGMGTTKANSTWWKQLADGHALIAAMVKRHPYGPMDKTLRLLMQEVRTYDPIAQGNLPNRVYNLQIGDRRVMNIRLPSPTTQEYINKAAVAEEFKGFLRSLGPSNGRHLLINIQDKTSWKEHKRCVVLEELQKHREFSDNLTVVTLTKDTDFYNQVAPYDELNHATAFIKQFKDHIADENAGFHFPQEVREALFPKWIDQALTAVHRTFFGGKNVLGRKQRLEFIEIFYLLLQLKLIEVTKASSFSLTCKDGLDTGNLASAQLYVFLKLLAEEPANDDDARYLSMMLYLPALMTRERNVLSNRFDRMVDAIRAVESVKDEQGRSHLAKGSHGHLRGLFEKETLDAGVSLATSEEL